MKFIFFLINLRLIIRRIVSICIKFIKFCLKGCEKILNLLKKNSKRITWGIFKINLKFPPDNPNKNIKLKRNNKYFKWIFSQIKQR